MTLAGFHPKHFFLETWQDIDAERAAAGTIKDSGATVAYIYIVVGVSLILQEYFGNSITFSNMVYFAGDSRNALTHPFLYGIINHFVPDGYYSWRDFFRASWSLWNLGYWALWRVFGFLVFPAIAVALHPRLRFSEIGFSLKGFSEHVWIYALFFLPVLVAVIGVSFINEFTEYYPFYRNAHQSLKDFLIWESLYIAQFFSLEFFFRGFMLQPLRRISGSGAIFAMMIPYVMIHFSKPLIECFGAVLAGIVLGTFAMKTRSIWAGFMIHVSVALSMDIAAIIQKNGLPF